MPRPPLTDEGRHALRAQFDENAAAARTSGKVPSPYFLDKCGAEAGATAEPPFPPAAEDHTANRVVYGAATVAVSCFVIAVAAMLLMR